jgi:hyaluronan synthase
MRHIDLGDTRPSVVLLVIGYREYPEYWIRCLKSILQSDYAHILNLQVFIDGDEEEDMYMRTLFYDVMIEHDLYPSEIHMCRHAGKRHAMNAGFRYILDHIPDNEYIIVMDSDTIVQSDAIHRLVECIHNDPKNGCATGNLRIFNKDTWLARIIDARYSYAFLIERGAMSTMGVMNCCSGPFSIYRQAFIDTDMLDEFVGERYCGHTVGPGDDRHLTLLMMGRGHRSRQTPLARVETETPNKFHRYFQQQLRWMRSFFREQVWQVRAIPYHHPYLIAITIYEIFFPIFILLSFFPTFDILNRTDSLYTFYIRIMIAISIIVIRTIILMCFNNCELASLWNLCVFPIYFILLLPIKMYALLTVGSQGWITSTRNKKNPITNLCHSDIFFIYLSVLGWNCILIYLLYNLFHKEILYVVRVFSRNT